jgi:hypothetical protein
MNSGFSGSYDQRIPGQLRDPQRSLQFPYLDACRLGRLGGLVLLLLLLLLLLVLELDGEGHLLGALGRLGRVDRSFRRHGFVWLRSGRCGQACGFARICLSRWRGYEGHLPPNRRPPSGVESSHPKKGPPLQPALARQTLRHDRRQRLQAPADPRFGLGRLCLAVMALNGIV